MGRQRAQIRVRAAAGRTPSRTPNSDKRRETCMQTEVLYEFVALAKHLNFRRAAEATHVSVSTLSKHISSLERELGVELFDRSNGTRLTPAGERFYARILHILDELESCIAETRATAKEAPLVRVLWLGQESSILERTAPACKVPYRPVMANPEDSALDLLERDKVDVVGTYSLDADLEAARRAEQRRLEAVPLGESELSLIVSRSSPLSEKESLSREDLRGAEMLVIYGGISREAELAIPGIFGADLGIKVVQDPSVLIGLGGVPARDPGRRIVLHYRSSAHLACEKRPDLVAFDTLDGKPIMGSEYLVYRTDDPNPNVKAFVEEVRELTESERQAAPGTGAPEDAREPEQPGAPESGAEQE